MFQARKRVFKLATAVLTAPLLTSGMTYCESPLKPSEFTPFTIHKIEELTDDTKRYTFNLPNELDTVGVKTAGLLTLRVNVDGVPVERPYTPVTHPDQIGFFELVIKSYPNGKVSKVMGEMKEGATVEMKGPWTKYEYEANKWKAVGLIAGGSGITPFMQLIKTILNNPRDNTEIRLLYASRSANDIILKKELDALAVLHPQFKIEYFLDNNKDLPTAHEGFIDAKAITSFLPPPSDEYKIMLCGPPPFINALCGPKDGMKQGPLAGVLKELNYTENQVFKY